jgi:transcriptional regulator with XRE-family HTH domain
MTKEKLGERIKKFREMNELSRQDLAERSGLSLDFIIGLETENEYPSLGPLLKVARAIGVRLGTFLDDEVSKDPLVIRLDERQEELSMQASKKKSVALRFYGLGKGKIDRHMEPFFVKLLPESEQDKSLSSHEGEEFIVVVSGKVELIYGKETTILEPGDSAYYNSIVPHHVGSAGGEPAEIYAVLYFPE